MKVIWAEEHLNKGTLRSHIKIKFADGSSNVFRIEGVLEDTYLNVETGIRYGDSALCEPVPEFIKEALKFIQKKKQEVRLKDIQSEASKIKWSQ